MTVFPVADLAIGGDVDDLVGQREAGSPDLADADPDLELVAEMGRRSIVALGARDDHAGMRRRRAGHLAPERQPPLLEIGEVDGVIDVAHRVAVAEAHAQPMTVRDLAGHRDRACAVEYPTTVAFPTTTTETFTPDEARALAPYFTNTDRPVFVLRNLPETVKGALFARYSRSAKSVRRLFLDEFLGEMGRAARRRPGRRRRRQRTRRQALRPRARASTATTRSRSSAARTSPAKASRTS